MSTTPAFEPRTTLTLSEASMLLGVSWSAVRLLMRKGWLREHERIPIKGGIEQILVRRDEVERLEREGWPGRRARRRTRPTGP